MSPYGVLPFMRHPGASDVRRVPVKVLVREDFTLALHQQLGKLMMHPQPSADFDGRPGAYFRVGEFLLGKHLGQLRF